MPAPSYESFLDQVPVDGRAVMREAIRFARYERRLDLKVFGSRKTSLLCIAKAGMQRAMDRENARRGNIASGLYRAALDPVTREIRQHELQIELLRDKRLGKTHYARQRIDEQIAYHAERLAELKQPFAQAAE
jgi:hypothetical protein